MKKILITFILVFIFVLQSNAQSTIQEIETQFDLKIEKLLEIDSILLKLINIQNRKSELDTEIIHYCLKNKSYRRFKKCMRQKTLKVSK